MYIPLGDTLSVGEKALSKRSLRLPLWNDHRQTLGQVCRWEHQRSPLPDLLYLEMKGQIYLSSNTIYIYNYIYYINIILLYSFFYYKMYAH